VCGTCDNPYTMAALDDFEIQGDILRFNILHEDWGDGSYLRSISTSRPTSDGMNFGALPRWTISRRLDLCHLACPRLLAHRTNCDRGDSRKPLARLAPTEHFLTSLASSMV